MLGLLSKAPVGGVVWQTAHYLVGLQRLGFDVYYVEAHSSRPSGLLATEADGDGSAKAAACIDGFMRRFGLADRWAYHALHAGGQCYGLSRLELTRLYASAELILNLHGGTLPLPEHCATGRLVYVETDPVEVQVQLARGCQSTIDFLSAHCAFFSFGENLGRPGCLVPESTRFKFQPTRQPVVLDFWEGPEPLARPVFTSIGNWRQTNRDLELGGETYRWSKHHEFLKFLELPARTGAQFELALSRCPDDERAMLQARGFGVSKALDFTLDPDEYRRFIRRSLGEFTVAKDQNVRLRSGWFSDRSATYLAAGRPVITQDTGFGDVLPTGQGLFAFKDLDEIEVAVRRVSADHENQSRAAKELAREYFSAEKVLASMLARIGI